MKTKTKAIENYGDLAEHLGYSREDSPYSLGRRLYKCTDCGPWMAFCLPDQPQKTVVETARLVADGKTGQACLENAGDLSGEFIQFLGFDKDGLSKKERSWKEYRGLIQKFVDDQEEKGKTFRDRRIEVFWDRIAAFRVKSTHIIPATTKKVYYEDKEAQTDEFNDAIIGIEIGSIVEGSDVEIGPEYLEFPFTPEQFDSTVQEINDQASFYWHRDNSHWFVVYKEDSPFANFKECWGEYTWDEDDPGLTEQEKKAIIDFLDTDEGFNAVSCGWATDGKKTPVPGTNLEVQEYINDSIF